MKPRQLFYIPIILLATLACKKENLRKQDFFKPEILERQSIATTSTGDTIRSQSQPRIVSNLALLKDITIGESGLNSPLPILPYDSLRLAAAFKTFDITVDSTFKTRQHFYKIDISTKDCIKMISLIYDSLDISHLPTVQIYDSRIMDDYGLSIADHAKSISEKHLDSLEWTKVNKKIRLKTRAKKKRHRYKTKHIGYTVQSKNSCIQYTVRLDSIIDQIKFVNM